MILYNITIKYVIYSERRGEAGETGEKAAGKEKGRTNNNVCCLSRFPEGSSGFLVFNNEMVMSPKV